MTETWPVIIVGAGVAGLSAAIELAEAGIAVVILEARDRIGGRVYTQHVPGCAAPIELGAEFIHGKAPEILDPLQKAGKEIVEVEGESWCATPQGLTSCDFFSEIDEILDKMDDSSPDESFLDFLERCFPNRENDPRVEESKQGATSYVSGFNAADPALVGVHWLVQEMRAEEKMEGTRAFRPKHGYDDLLELLRQRTRDLRVQIQTSTVVESIAWKKSSVQLHARSADGTSTLSASAVLITVPLGVLKARPGERGAIQITPALPAEKMRALDTVEMGDVIRVVLRFRERFWDSLRPSGDKTLSDMSFLLSEDPWFPTWWTTMPEKHPIITGWAPFLAGRRLSGKDPSLITQRAVETLSRLMGVDDDTVENMLQGSYFHDWQSDPFSRGAYSYGKVGAVDAQRELAAPIENTLFFAGEATDTTGNNGTVHGAIASGHRAAHEILRGRR